MKYIVKFTGCEKSQIIDELESIGCENISQLNRVGAGFVVADLTDDQASLIKASDCVESVAKMLTPRPSNVSLYTTTGTSIITSGLDSLDLLGPGSDFLSGQHYYNTDLDVTPSTLSVGVNESDDQSAASFEYQSYWTGENVDIVIFDVDTPREEFADHSSHIDLAVSANDSENSRVKVVDWGSYSPGVTEVFNRQTLGLFSIWSSHATGAASAAAGLYGGLAKKSNIYVIHASGDDTILDCFDAIQSWAQTKPINPVTGVRNPTIVYMGWAFDQKSHFIPVDDIIEFEVSGLTISRQLDVDGVTYLPWSEDLFDFREQNIPLIRVRASSSEDRRWAVRVNEDFTLEEQTLDDAIDQAISVLKAANCIIVGAPKNDAKVFVKKGDISSLDNVTCVDNHTVYTIHENYFSPEHLHPNYEDFIAPNEVEWETEVEAFNLSKDRLLWNVTTNQDNHLIFNRISDELEPYVWQDDPLNQPIVITDLIVKRESIPAQSYKLFQAPIGYGGDDVLLATSALGSDYADALHWSSPRGRAFSYVAYAGGAGLKNITEERQMYQSYGSFQPYDFTFFYNTETDINGYRWSMFGGTSAAAATTAGYLALLWENVANRTQSLPAASDIVDYSLLLTKSTLSSTLSMLPPVFVRPETVVPLDPSSTYSSDAYEIIRPGGTIESLDLAVIEPNISISFINSLESVTAQYGLLDLYGTRENTVINLPESVYNNPGLRTFSDDEIIQPKPAEEPEPEPRFLFGLNTQNSLSEIVDEAEALANLNIDINDLDRIRGIRSAGITQEDLKTISGLDSDIIRELYALSKSFVISEFLFKDYRNEQFVFDEIVSKMKYEIDSQVISRSYKYSYVEPEIAAQPKFADVSTSRISSWSSFDDDDINAPIFYAGDLNVNVNDDGKSKIYANELSTKIQPVSKKYSAEVPTHLITLNIDGVDKQFYAMSGIPLNFYGRFRRVVDGGLSHAITREENDPKPVWAIQNLDETGTYFDFTNLDDRQGIQFLDFRTRPRLVQFYYDPNAITELSVVDINILNLPNASLQSLEKLNVSSNDIKTMPDFNQFSPNVLDLNVSNNDLRRAENYTPASDQLLNIPSSVELLNLSATLQHISSNPTEPSLEHLPNLKELIWEANGLRSTITFWHTTPPISRNQNEPTISPSEAQPNEVYEIIDLGDGNPNPTGDLSTWTDYIDIHSISYDAFRSELLDHDDARTIAPLNGYTRTLFGASTDTNGSYIAFKNIPPAGTGVLKPVANDVPLEKIVYTNHMSQADIDGNAIWPLPLEAKVSDTILGAKNLEEIDLTGSGIAAVSCGDYNSTVLLKAYITSENVTDVKFNSTVLFPPSVKFKQSLLSYSCVLANFSYANSIQLQKRSHLNWTYAKNDISVEGEHIFEGCVSLEEIDLALNGVFMNLSAMVRDLPSLTIMKNKNMIYGNFTRNSFAGCSRLKTVDLQSSIFGVRTRAPWVSIEDDFDSTAIALSPEFPGQEFMSLNSVLVNNTYDSFFESDCLFDLTQLVEFIIQGTDLSQQTDGQYLLSPSFPTTTLREQISANKTGFFARGELPSFATNTDLETILISGLYVTGPVPDISNNLNLKSLVLDSLRITDFIEINSPSLTELKIDNCPNLSTSVTNPIPAINCPLLTSLSLAQNFNLSGPLPNFATMPLLNNISLQSTNFSSYQSGTLSGLFQLKSFSASDTSLRVVDVQQIIKDIYSSYLVSPRTQGQMDFRLIQGVSLQSILSDGPTLVAYNTLVNIANWVILV